MLTIPIMLIMLDSLLLYLAFGIKATGIYFLLLPVISFLLDAVRFFRLHPRNEKRIMISECISLTAALNILSKKGVDMSNFRIYITLCDIDTIQYIGLRTLVIPQRIIDTHSNEIISSIISHSVGHSVKLHSFFRNVFYINLFIFTALITTAWSVILVILAVIIGSIAKKTRSKLLTLIFSLLTGLFCYIGFKKMIKLIPDFFRNISGMFIHMMNCTADRFTASVDLGEYFIEYLRTNDLSDENYDRIQKMERLIKYTP